MHYNHHETLSKRLSELCKDHIKFPLLNHRIFVDAYDEIQEKKYNDHDELVKARGKAK